MIAKSRTKWLATIALILMTFILLPALYAKDYTNPRHSHANSLYTGTKVFTDMDTRMVFSQDKLHSSSVDTNALFAISAGIEQSFSSYRPGFSLIALSVELSQEGTDITDGSIILSLSRSETASTSMDIYYGVDLGLISGTRGDNTGRTGFIAGLHVGPHFAITDHLTLRTAITYFHRFWGEEEDKVAVEHQIGARIGIAVH